MVLAAPEQPLGHKPLAEESLVLGNHTPATVTDSICRIVESRTPPWWFIAFAFSLCVLGILGLNILWLLYKGVGVWGNNVPVGWAWDITNFVFWIGIGHAGTLISAILFLFRQHWRTSINRFAEAMTIFAVMCAGIYPAIHVGRVWLLYWVFPVPNQMSMWPNFRSPLLWDVFAVSTYATVSALFWYVGMIPDLASLRDRAKDRPRQIIYGILAMGWRGSGRHWKNYEWAYLLLAGLSTPLVLSVHSVVSFDFAVSILPGWHTTIFPPYFVAGAIFSGFAMVVTLMIPARWLFKLDDFVTPRHLDNMCKIMLATGSIVGYAYAIEIFTAWYSGNFYERFAFASRALGPYAWAYWIMVFCNVVAPQVFWSARARRSVPVMFGICILINIGMWFERFVIIVSSLARDYIPSSWRDFHASWVDIMTFAGSFGLFLTMFLLFVRFLPLMAMAETKAILPSEKSH